LGIKQQLRSALFVARQARMRLGRLLHPPVRWDGKHDPILSRFPPWSGEADGTFCYDFLGVKTDPRFRKQMQPQPAGKLTTDHLPPHAGYFEILFVLDSVLQAPGPSFDMLELGAGYGPWMVMAHRAMQQTHGYPVQLTGIEMVPRHFKWMQQHFRNNGLNPDEHRLIQAAISDYDGTADFREDTSALGDFGQRVKSRVAGGAASPGDTPPAAHGDMLSIPCIDLRRLLEEHERLDLVHVDIQGEERRALTPVIDLLSAKVDRLIVATHSSGIHRDLRRTLRAAGWNEVYDFGYRKRERTPFGDVQFLDGLLAYVNPQTRSRRPEPVPG